MNGRRRLIGEHAEAREPETREAAALERERSDSGEIPENSREKRIGDGSRVAATLKTHGIYTLISASFASALYDQQSSYH